MNPKKEEKMNPQKKIALIAHDNKKNDLINWCKLNSHILQKHKLYGTGTTSKLIKEKVKLEVNGFKSGPLGGDLQIGSRICENEINFLIFFWDPLSAQPHDPDVRALLRIAVLYNIPFANNIATADFILNSKYMHEHYIKDTIDVNKISKERVKMFEKEVL